MNTRRSNYFGVTTLSLAMLAGAAAPAFAQNATATRHDRISDRETTSLDRFAKSSTLVGAEVYNHSNEHIASVEDFIIDRGSGEITQAILKSGGVLGLGGKTIAVPFSRLKWDDAESQYSLDMTQERIDRAVEFDPEDWPNLDHTTWSDRVERWWSGERDSNMLRNDPWAAKVTEARTQRVKGTITQVNRRTLNGEEQVIVRVKADDGEMHDLLLGPTWFVMSAPQAPMRGNTITAAFASVSHEDDMHNVASLTTINGERLTLRDSQGLASWDLPTNSRTDDSSATGRLMLVSDLVGATAKSASDKEAGEIQNVLIEKNAARVAVLGFDPNENFLGLGDEIKCVPWSIVNIAPNGTVRIDASDEQLSNAVPMPERIATLGSPESLKPVYSAFGVPMERFERRTGSWQSSALSRPGFTNSKPGTKDARDSAKSNERAFFKNFVDAQVIRIEGEIESISTNAKGDNAPVLRTITVKTDKGARDVVIGPEWFMATQDMPLHRGDKVVINARKATVGGSTHYAATSVRTPDREFAIWDSDTPAWNDG